jgi:nucleoid-associated protein YgaU
MNKYGYVLLGILLVFNTGITLQAEEAEAAETEAVETEVAADVQPGYVDSFLHNEYLLESIRLLALAEESLTAGKFDEASQYAAEAEKYAKLSDDYVSLQMKIKETNDAIAAAEDRMARAKATGAAGKYAETYGEAELVYTEALDFRTGEEWDKAKDSALRVLAILNTLPDETVLPAQYLVRNWATTKDCLWNIAAKPEIYGNPRQWQHIYNANKDKLANNPNIIEPGMLLDIPSIRGEVRYGILEGTD